MKTIFGAGINVGAQKASSADVHIQHSTRLCPWSFVSKNVSAAKMLLLEWYSYYYGLCTFGRRGLLIN